MATMIATQHQVLPGRREDFMEVLRQARIHQEARGAVVRTRQVFGGTATGTLQRLSLFEDAMKRAAFLDSGGPSASNPVRNAVNSANPPATLLTLGQLDEINPSGGIPPDSELLDVAVFRAAPGRRGEADAAFAEARERHEGLGASVSLWQAVLSGENSGLIVRSMAFDSWSAREAFMKSNAALPTPAPFLRATDSGSLILERWYVSLRLDV